MLAELLRTKKKNCSVRHLAQGGAHAGVRAISPMNFRLLHLSTPPRRSVVLGVLLAVLVFQFFSCRIKFPRNDGTDHLISSARKTFKTEENCQNSTFCVADRFLAIQFSS